MSVNEVLAGQRRWWVEQGDVLDWLAALPADSCDLLFTSPPYSNCRLYLEDGRDLDVARDTEEWVQWMVTVVLASLRVCTGLCAFVVDDQTKDYRYGGGPLLLAADLIRRGVCLRRPCIYRRVGIPGSGRSDWLRNDHELVLCATRGGPLPWSDNTACGHPPKWAPGGKMSHRLKNGQRMDKWGCSGGGGNERNRDGTRHKSGRPSRPADIVVGQESDQPTLFDDERTKKNTRTASSGFKNGDISDRSYTLPVLANPGNVIDCGVVGGGQMGSAHAHDNEAPFPLELATFFVRSFCPPGGVTADPFTGSGTVGHACLDWGRRFLGSDLRPSQVALSRLRLENVTPALFS